MTNRQIRIKKRLVAVQMKPSAAQMKGSICSEKNAEEKQAFASITDILRILLSDSGKESGLLFFSEIL